VTFSADSASLIVTSAARVDIYSMADGALSASHQLTTTSAKSFHPSFGPDGRLWLSRHDDLAAIDLATGVQTYYGFDSGTLAIFGDKIYAGGASSSNFNLRSEEHT